MKIVITNNIALNGGDAAILLGMIEVLKKRFGDKTTFVVTCDNPTACAQLYPNIYWRTVLGRVADSTPYNHIRYVGRIARLIKRYRFYTAAFFRRKGIPLYKLLLSKYDSCTLNEYASSDYIISSGGTYLIEAYGITTQYIDYKISIILGKPLVQYTQSMGPFTSNLTKKRLRSVFNHCHTILLRDNQSKTNVYGLNLRNSSILHIVPDAAFALGDIDNILKRKNDSIGQYGNVAISVRNWLHTKDSNTMPKYRESIAEAVVMLIDLGYRVHFFSTCQGITSYTDDNDEVKKILSLVPTQYHSRINKYDHYLPIPSIINLLGEMDLIIATRLHMSILALISGTPVYPIAYEFKTVELYHSLGYENVDTLDTLSPVSLCNSITAFIESFTKTRRAEIYTQVAKFINDSISAVNFIK